MSFGIDGAYLRSGLPDPQAHNNGRQFGGRCSEFRWERRLLLGRALRGLAHLLGGVEGRGSAEGSRAEEAGGVAALARAGGRESGHRGRSRSRSRLGRLGRMWWWQHLPEQEPSLQQQVPFGQSLSCSHSSSGYSHQPSLHQAPFGQSQSLQHSAQIEPWEFQFSQQTRPSQQSSCGLPSQPAATSRRPQKSPGPLQHSSSGMHAWPSQQVSSKSQRSGWQMWSWPQTSQPSQSSSVQHSGVVAPALFACGARARYVAVVVVAALGAVRAFGALAAALLVIRAFRNDGAEVVLTGDAGAEGALPARRSHRCCSTGRLGTRCRRSRRRRPDRRTCRLRIPGIRCR